MLNGKSLVAGEWMEGTSTFANEVVEGIPDQFSLGNSKLVDNAANAAQDAFQSYGFSSRSKRAAFLKTIANEIESLKVKIIKQGAKETGYAHTRLEGEMGRTCMQLRLFADYIEHDDYLDLRHETADPYRSPIPKPDLKLVQRPIGPVGVFGASNFPLAFSTAGGDTAAALAAGCPVVVKAHAAHAGVCDLVAQAILEAIKRHNLHPGVFSQIQGSDRSIGEALVQHPHIKAIGFTGSTTGGRALFNLCAARPEPIPFFGELGSVNPVFILPHALISKSDEIAATWVQSLILGAGQFCTNPGIVVAIKNSDTQKFIESAIAKVSIQDEQVMLTTQIARSYQEGQQGLADNSHVDTLYRGLSGGRFGAPAIFSTSVKNWLHDKSLQEEVFGATAQIVLAEDEGEVLQFAGQITGQLTCAIHHEYGDAALLRKLLPLLEQKAGRLLSNGFPTGVEVSHAMVHGGPYPASTNFGATSVGTLSIRRFLRPVSYQNFDWPLIEYTKLQ